MEHSSEDRPSAAPPVRDTIPRGLQVGAAYTWRVLVIALGIAAVIGLAIWLSEIVIPFMVGLLLSALLVPMSRFLQRHHWPKWIAIITAWIAVFAVITGLVLLVVQQVRVQLPSIQQQIMGTVRSAESLLASHPFGITEQDVDHYLTEGAAWLQKHASEISAGAAEAGSSVAHILEGVFIVIFVTLFALIDGRGIWTWTTKLFPRAAQGRIAAAGAAGWHTLTSFIRIQLVVAATDGIFIGIGAAILGVPLAVPIGVVVFFGAFVPVVGAIVGGIVAVGLALIFNGWVHAVIMLGIVLLVQQLESHLLHPLITGTAVKIHPLGVVLGVVTGAAVAGVIGAFFAVPFIATVNSMILAARRWTPQSEPAPAAAAGAPVGSSPFEAAPTEAAPVESGQAAEPAADDEPAPDPSPARRQDPADGGRRSAPSPDDGADGSRSS